MSLTVATVLKSGGEYDATWVRRLKRQVAEHLDAPHTFVCLTDMTVPDVPTTPLAHDWPGYWSKMELYREGLFGGRVIYFDLDTLIVDDITPLAEYDGPFAALRDFYNSDIQASGVLAFDGTDPPPLYKLALSQKPRMRRNARTDLFWNQFLKADVLQDLYPGMFASYKAHGLTERPGDHHVICFHGHPRQSDFGPDHWVTKAWTGE